MHTDNGKTFSYEFASILRDACSAFASFSDAVVRGSDPSKASRKSLNIKDFFDFYHSKCEPDPTEKYLTQGYIDVIPLRDAYQGAHRLQPFWGWTAKDDPRWWTAYNRIKHSEYECAKEGNLQNATNAIAAVWFILRGFDGNEKRTRLLSGYGGPWKPGQKGEEHIQRLFGPENLPLGKAEQRLKAFGLTTGDESTTWVRELRDQSPGTMRTPG